MDEIEAIIRKYIEDVNFYDTLEDVKAIVDVDAMIKEVVEFRVKRPRPATMHEIQTETNEFPR